MSTFFPAGGQNADPGSWWRVLHSSIEAGADISTLRLLHAVGAGPMTRDHCIQLERVLSPHVACVRYDQNGLLLIEPNVTDHQAVEAAQQVLGVTSEQIRLWRAVGVHENGLEFVPLDVENIEAEAERQAEPHPVNDIVLTDAEFSYFPMWNVRASEVFGYVCETVWNFGEGAYVPEEALEAFFTKHRHVYALDKEALHKAVAQAQDFLDRYMFTNIVIPVHFSTLATPELAAPYLDACNEGVWTVMDNVLFEITKVPVDVDGDTLFQAINNLAPYGQEVWLRLQHGFDNFSVVPLEMVASLGLGFQYTSLTDEEVASELEAFSRDTQNLGLARHAHGLHDMNTCISAVNSGFDFISSSAIAPPLDPTQPEDMAQPSDVLRAMLRG